MFIRNATKHGSIKRQTTCLNDRSLRSWSAHLTLLVKLLLIPRIYKGSMPMFVIRNIVLAMIVTFGSGRSFKKVFPIFYQQMLLEETEQTLVASTLFV